jgi:anti-anti-sigma factor
MDCAGLGLLCSTFRRVRANGGRLCLVYAGSCVHQLLRQLSLTSFFPTATSVGEARRLVEEPSAQANGALG